MAKFGIYYPPPEKYKDVNIPCIGSAIIVAIPFVLATLFISPKFVYPLVLSQVIVGIACAVYGIRVQKRERLREVEEGEKDG